MHVKEEKNVIMWENVCGKMYVGKCIICGKMYVYM
jgi:hypothetical protein